MYGYLVVLLDDGEEFAEVRGDRLSLSLSKAHSRPPIHHHRARFRSKVAGFVPQTQAVNIRIYLVVLLDDGEELAEVRRDRLSLKGSFAPTDSLPQRSFPL